ncbi:MAG: glycosyltransferase, partial [Lachnospiraceae bacterium]
YFEPEELEIYLMAEDIRALLEAERIVFFEGEEQFWDFFQKDKGLPPTIFYGENYQYFKEKWENLYILRNLHCSAQKRNLELYYLENDESIRERIKSGKFKILFITSLFTTILQYHTRDLALEAEKLGCSVKILTEEMPIEMMPPTRVCQAVEEFRPDMVFSIDHFRYEFNLPSSLRWGCWIQDPMSHIMNPLSIEKMEKRDLILNHFTTWGKFLALGYGERCTMIDAPIPANEEVYKPYELSDEEWVQYGADLSFVCHASDDEKLLKDSKGNSEVADVLVQYICNAYKESVYQWGEFLYTKEEFALFIQEKLRELDIIGEEKDFVAQLSLFMFDKYNQRIYRITLVQWLIDAGYTNIKLWGNGWMENEKFKPYAMGPAENGEELSKIYQASKINIGNNIMTTAAARAWECMLSGGFYLSNWIPEEADITDIRRIVKLGEDVDFFRTKEEFLKKIDFYLTHEEARRKMIEKGRAISLEKMTYKKLMERIMDTLKEKCNEEGYN